MKKLFNTIAVLALLLLVGCAKKEEEPVTEPFSYSGVFEYYQQTESGCEVTISTESGLVTIPYEILIPEIEQVVPGYELTLSGDYYPEEMLYKGTLFTVDNIPLEIQLGYAGEDLMSQTYDSLFQSLLAQVDYASTYSEGGRQTQHHDKVSYYIDQDESASYTNLVGQTTVGTVTSNWSSMEYIDRDTLDRYYIYNYGNWTHSKVDSAPFITFSLPTQDFTVDSFELDGDRVVVSGTASPTQGTYLSYLLAQTFEGIDDYAGNVNISYIAKFSQDDRAIKYAEYTVTADEPLKAGDTLVNIDSLVITLSGIDFNDVKSVSIPNHVIAYAPEEASEAVSPSDMKFYESVLGIELEDVTEDWVINILGNPYEVTPAGCDPDETVRVATDIILNYSADEFMDLAQSEDLTPEEIFVVNALSLLLQNGVE